MKKLLLACLLAVPLMAIPSQAWAWGLGCLHGDCEGCGHGCLHGGHLASLHGHIAGLHGWLGAHFGGHDNAPSVPQAGPWYLYWPYQAHFQTPAPLPFPYYTPTQVLPPGFQGAGQPYQPVGYAPQAAPGH